MLRSLEKPAEAWALFEGWQETMIWSCLQGRMGSIYAAAPGWAKDAAAKAGTAAEAEIAGTAAEKAGAVAAVRSVAAVLGDFSFFAGVPDEELVSLWPDQCRPDFRIMVPGSAAWAALIEDCYGESARRVVRYAMKKEPEVFDRERLSGAAAALAGEYSLRPIDEELYFRCREEQWSTDLVSQFETYEKFRRLGLGVVAVKAGAIVSGASSYSSYQGGIEIEIDTKREFQRKGLAYGCGAKLILECLERGLYPSWDAQNLQSVALAKKLGYHFDHEYAAYEIFR